MSNVHYIYDANEQVVKTYKSLGPAPNYGGLAERHGLPLLDVDHEDGNRLTAIIESIPCRMCHGRGGGQSRMLNAWAGPYGYCDYCGGRGKEKDIHGLFPDEQAQAVVERWKRDMVRGGAFGDRYWEPGWADENEAANECNAGWPN